MYNDYSQALFEAIPEGAILLDKNARIVDWNQNATSLFGYPKREMLGKSINMLYQQHYPFTKLIQETLVAEKKWITETGYIRKNGAKGVCKIFLLPINCSQPDNKAQALVTHQNISIYKDTELEQKKISTSLTQLLQAKNESSYFTNLMVIKNLAVREQLEKHLRESELRFHLLAQNATDMISRHTPDGTYLYVSPSCQTLMGYTPEELMQSNVYKFLHFDDVNKLKKIFAKRRDHSNHHTVTYRIRKKEGDYRWVESNVRTIFDEETKILREIQAASRDITDRVLDKKARLRGQQLARVFRLSTMEEMASGMAHEISQPLAAIVNYTQGCVRYLQNNQHDRNQLIEIMKKAVLQAERAGEVIQRLKNFFCKGKLFKTPCKVNSLIRETVSLIRNELNNSKSKVDFDLDKEVKIITLDRIQLQQVLLNLIQNAMEAMETTPPQTRRIQISTKKLDENFIEITVSDSGPGFSKEMVHKVFEPFFTTKAYGRGMGLAICRSIIEAHGGQFKIHPNTHDKSWIRFVLPVN